MTHPEIKVSWVSLFLKAFGTLIASRAEQRGFFFPISENQRSASRASRLNLGLIMSIL
jgi:hypothetical protein